MWTAVPWGGFSRDVLTNCGAHASARSFVRVLHSGRLTMNRIIALALAGVFGAALFAANKPVTVALKNGDGKDAGTARISDGPKGMGVRIALNLKGLPPG